MVTPPTTIRVPWIVFDLVVAAAGGLLLWAFSVPAFALVPTLVATGVLAVAGIVWVVWLAVARPRRWRQLLGFAVAPAMVTVVVLLLATGVPLQARWAKSRDAFNQVVKALPAATAAASGDRWISIDVPSTIGGYRISCAYRVPGGVVFYEEHGSGLDDAGFAYLPDGPTASLENGSFESPTFRRLGKGWYAWTASW